ncbi:MAG: AraC family transcriptional regulator, partial [Rhizobiaceae bacterium]
MRRSAFSNARCPAFTASRPHSAHIFPRHAHDQFGIGIIRAGAQTSMSGRGMVEAGPG